MAADGVMTDTDTVRELSRRSAALRAVTAQPEELRLTAAGVELFAAAARAPQPPGDLPPELREQHDRLFRAGLIGSDGSVTEPAADAASALLDPAVVLQVTVSSGADSRTWTAWLGSARAFVAASLDRHGHEHAIQVVVPGWALVAAARWLGITPRPRQPAEELRVDQDLLAQRAAGADVPLPDAAPPALRAVWTQPLSLWAAEATPGDGSLLVLDAGAAGLWQIRTEDSGGSPVAVLMPRRPRVVWHELVRLVVAADIARRNGRPGSSSS